MVAYVSPKRLDLRELKRNYPVCVQRRRYRLTQTTRLERTETDALRGGRKWGRGVSPKRLDLRELKRQGVKSSQAGVGSHPNDST